jgi:predicted RNA binding protein YcfA (HicA-like mRNA interferase family)
MRLKITYGDLIKKLIKVGFEEKRMKGSHLILYNEKFNSTIVLPLFKRNKIAEQYIIMTVRKNLVEKGVLNKEQFNELINNKI